MQNRFNQAPQSIRDHLHKSSSQICSSFNAMQDITMQIGAFHMARAEVYQKTFEKMTGLTNLAQLVDLQQEFIQSSMDNLLSHSTTMAELLARLVSFENHGKGRI